VAIPTINALPEAPLPSDSPEVFNSKAFAFVDALGDMVEQMNAAILAINAIYSQDVVDVSGTNLVIDFESEGVVSRFSQDGAKLVGINSIELETCSEFAIFHILNDSDSGNITFTLAGVDLIPPAGGTNVVPPGGMVSVKRLSETRLKLIGQVVAA